ncbi:MAG: family 16 glycoside hydrolase [Akkermansiaceae bacterium]
MKKQFTIKLSMILLMPAGSLKASELKQQFEPQKKWNYFGEVKHSGRDLNVVSQGDDIVSNISPAGKLEKADFLRTVEKFQDVHMKLEFMVPKRSNSGAYFMGRYEIQILDSFGRKKFGSGDLGGLYQRWDENRNPKGFEGVKPKVNAAKAPGEWQTMEVIFRAPRFAKDGSKTHHAKFIKVLVNDQLVHENQIAKGPTRSSKFGDESAKPAAIYFQGDHGPVAIRKIELKKLNLSTDGEKALSGAEAAPLDNKGRPLMNAVAYGEQLFKAKGCVECHSTSPSEVKTGPSIYGLFSPRVRQVEVLEADEGHKKMLPADIEYLKYSLRRPLEALSLKPDGTAHLPIMPVYNFKLISDEEVGAIYSYLLTLNKAEDAGASVLWKKKPNPKYELEKDTISKWVKGFPRLERVDMGEHISARAYHVGLPGDMNYSFDPRNMAVAQIWDGPFMRKKDQVGRGKGGAEKGYKGRDYGIGNLFQPYDTNGEVVDLTFASPARMFDEKQSAKFLSEKSDFLAEVGKFPATFLGAMTPKQKVPTFSYSVGGNVVSLEVNLTNSLAIEAKFDFDLKTEQHFAIPDQALKDIKVSHGKVSDGKWAVPAGKHKAVTFTATLPKLAGELYPSDISAEESYAPQDLVWNASEKKATLHPGYRIEDGSAPTDPFGRPLVFEALGIEFHKGEAFVSTRTAGIWKVVDGKWHLFAEGAYESIGLVVNSAKDVVIGEKAGLTRLIDSDGDHWAEKRENITDKFRFNGDYHEYLHGPIKLDGRYLFSLNLGNEVKGMYKANGKWMGTVGGLRGWMLSSDDKGNTEIFASGFRSPAGLALSPENEIIYTENQGEYVGTSKVFKVKKGGFHGNPNGLIDIPGKNTTSPEVMWDAVKDTRELPILLLPHGEVMNAPGSPEFLTDKITFGPFQGQMFLGDQLQSNIYRVDTQVVGGQEQAVTIPFAEGLKSGAMRLRFDPSDSSLWIGQTGRGWRARGGNTYALQRIVYDPKVTVDAIKTVKVTPKGFDVYFTESQSGKDETSNVQCKSWYYLNSDKYGSPKQGEREEKVIKTTWNADKTICHITLDNFKVEKEKSSDSSRVYRINLANTDFGKKHGAFFAKAYYTLHKIPNQ